MTHSFMRRFQGHRSHTNELSKNIKNKLMIIGKPSIREFVEFKNTHNVW
jgi:hypothetical protein